MYIHQQDWAAATRVAEQNDPAHVPDVLVAQAAVCVQRQEFTKAEALYIRAKRPELLHKKYRGKGADLSVRDSVGFSAMVASSTYDARRSPTRRLKDADYCRPFPTQREPIQLRRHACRFHTHHGT